uniref:lipoyl(octanoyl) transferase n=1 Tax=Ananas comosus var. bracteatus TaxID=296719 RepID=A0A6V7PQK8_ANACO|nr:unnamed protein product [Ananas comosus var. bracteatus]
MKARRSLEVWKMGIVNYLEALKLQEKLFAGRKAGVVPDLVLSLQHPPRTHSGKGERAVLYPILSLREIGFGARKYVEGLESVMIEVAASHGVKARPGRAGETGVWVGDRKIGAVGVRISSGITCHGLALNIDPELDYFKHIVPCGIADKEVTSLRRETNAELPADEVIHEQLIRCLARTFYFDDIKFKQDLPKFS